MRHCSVPPFGTCRVGDRSGPTRCARSISSGTRNPAGSIKPSLTRIARWHREGAATRSGWPPHFVSARVKPELVLCSSALRTRETLELVRPTLGPTATVSLEAGLYAASSNVLLERIRAVPEAVGSVMLIAHNPGLPQLAVVLASEGAELAQLEAKFPTAALATLTVQTTSWSRLSRADALLAAYVVPKLLG